VTKTALPMKEAQLQKTVIAMAKQFGWKVAHFGRAQGREGRWITPVQADGAGFPDLFLVRKRLAMCLELKAKGRKPSAEQVEWIDALNETPVATYVIHPEDLDSGFLETLLR
jgi:hypothetical protein